MKKSTETAANSDVRAVPFPPAKPTKRRPTLPNDVRYAMAALIRSKLLGVDIDWTSGHGSFLADGKAFCTITREGDLALKLSPERMEELIGTGEAQPRRFGERTMPEWIVIPPADDPPWALQLLREAKAYVESVPASALRPPAKKRR